MNTTGDADFLSVLRSGLGSISLSEVENYLTQCFITLVNKLVYIVEMVFTKSRISNEIVKNEHIFDSYY